jgi:hypothetical protein
MQVLSTKVVMVLSPPEDGGSTKRMRLLPNLAVGGVPKRILLGLVGMQNVLGKHREVLHVHDLPRGVAPSPKSNVRHALQEWKVLQLDPADDDGVAQSVRDPFSHNNDYHKKGKRTFRVADLEHDYA